MIVLGDQSPWVGGLLRWWALRELLPQKNTLYFFADGDSPYVQGGEWKPSITSGWPDYWTVGNRYPWVLDAPTAVRHESNNFKQVLATPPGLEYLIGSDIGETLYGASHKIVGLLNEMLYREISWCNALRELAGLSPHDFVVGKGATGLDIARNLAASAGLEEVQSETQMFLDSPPLLAQSVPRSFFWSIDERGFRKDAVSGSSAIRLFPKGKILPLEFAARGWTVGFTNLPYLSEVVALRDRLCPGLPISTVRIAFNWQTPQDFTALLLESYHSKKARRASYKGVPYSAELSAAASDLVTHAQAYWHSRPNFISWIMLGGELNPTITFEIL